MSLYTILLVIHVITAVAGLGQLFAIGAMTRIPEAANPAVLMSIFKAVGVSLIIMLLTGIGMMWILEWSFIHTWWMRISFLLTIALGAMHGMAQGALKRATANTTTRPGATLTGDALEKMKLLPFLMAITLLIIIFLMEAKPF